MFVKIRTGKIQPRLFFKPDFLEPDLKFEVDIIIFETDLRLKTDLIFETEFNFESDLNFKADLFFKTD